MKRQILLSLAVTLLALPSLARDFEYTYEGQTLTYTVIDEEAKTCATKAGTNWSAGNTVSGDLILPSNPKDGETWFTLVEIGDFSFYGNSLNSVLIPNTVYFIGDYAFCYCNVNNSITIPYSVMKIGCQALHGNFFDNIIVDSDNDYYTSIDGVLFNKDCTELIQFPNGRYKTSYTIPNSVIHFGLAFAGCSLSSIFISNSVTKIEENAFEMCYDLAEVTISNSVTSIGHNAFYSCYSLTEITIPKSVIEISSSAFSYCSGLTEINVDSCNNYYTSIDGVLFNKDCTELIQYPRGKTDTEYFIPPSVTDIGDGAFRNCSSLTSVILPNSLIQIGDYAFSDCSSLNSMTLPNSLKSIGSYAFAGCSGMTSVNIPNSVTQIELYTFRECSALTSIIIPNSVTNIRAGAFNFCSSLTSVYIPNSVTEIGNSPFSYCNCLKEINVDPINRYYSSIDGVLFNKDCTTLIQYPCGRTDTKYSIPNSVTTIDYSAFSGSNSLTTIIIPNSVTKILWWALVGCKNLISIRSYALTPPDYNIQNVIFNYEDITLYVPNQAVDAYKSAPEWGNFTNIIGFDTSKNIKVNGLNYIINMIDHTAIVTYAEQNSLSNYEGMLSIDIPETVEYDGESYTVTGIGEEAFNNCWGIKSVTLPSTLQSIGKLAFGYCTSLRSVVIPDEVNVIDDEAFTGCSALASVTIGNSVETIGDYAFFGCTGLASLHVPESVKSIGENAFMGIHWINEVHAESDVPAEAPVSAFSTNAYRNATLVVPDGALSSYKSHPTWSNFLAIREKGNSTTEIEVVDGAIVVRGSESVRIYNISGAQVYSGESGRIELPSGIYMVITDSTTRKVRI